jgi:hypothetical protein
VALIKEHVREIADMIAVDRRSIAFDMVGESVRMTR